MKFFYLLTLVAVLLKKGNPQDIGRNDGEPDYEPDDVMINLRDEGRNDGEPDYDPEGFMMDVRSEGRNDGEPDYDPEVMTFAPSEELRDAGRNEGEPDYDGGDDMEPKSIPLKVPDHPYRMLIPEEFKELRQLGDDFSRDGDGGDIAIEVPDSVWEREKNATRNRGESRFGRQSNPPSTACLNIRVIYNQGWVNSAGGGNNALAVQRLNDVIAEADRIYKTRYAPANRLQTAITWNVVGGAPSFGSGSWQATSSSLQSNAVQSHVTNSLDIHHYAFMAGRDGSGAIGIAYVGTPCFRLANDQRLKISINEWYNNVADSAGVLAHEVGHALGMYHDFGNGGTSDIKYDSNGNRCTGINGLLDYGQRSSVDKFTTCSKEDFATWYRRVMNTYGEFCLTCGGVVPTAPPVPTTVAPNCDGIPSTGWSCCSSSNPCNVGGGDCDTDSDCAGSLRCGNNNCRAIGIPGSNWSSSADCCEATTTAAPGLCDGVPSTDWSCCSSSNQCGVGEGDCDSDSHCAAGLQCGVNNCDRDFSSTGSNWASSADCCVATVPTTTPGPTVAPNCNGIPSTDWSCCSSSNQCNVGEGDCDTDSDCASGLACGTNNCRATALPGSNWGSSADCCIAPSTAPTTARPTNSPGQCNGVPLTDWSCCSSSSPCNVGGGDCDSDSHCTAGSTCGTNNCRRDFSSTGSNWGSAADCCIASPTTTTPGPTVAPNCNGVPTTGWSCCSSSSPCSTGGGDCDNDSECASGLTCGNNNCRNDFSSTGSQWSSAADCCIAPPSTTTSGPTVAPTCNGVPSTGWSCCSSSSPCSQGGGDCDNDNQCGSGLVCGQNNCRSDFSSTGSNWSSGADCCIAPTPTTPGPTVAPPTNCGIKPSAIVGGGAVTPYSLPWQVALVRPGSDRPFCGGILISERHVLTAAHCTSGTINVIVGEHSVTSSSDGTRHTICRYRDHPSYGNLNYDYAILHLNSPVTLGARAVPACLPPTTMNDAFLGGKTLTVSGWGALTQGGGSPTVLHSVDVPGMTNAQCNQNYPGDIGPSELCAGQPSGGIDSCQGDSGGPLTYTTGGKTYVVGVVSWGAGCARPGKPGVYARVTTALTWIQQQMAQTC